jgi:hypothetical protein
VGECEDLCGAFVGRSLAAVGLYGPALGFVGFCGALLGFVGALLASVGPYGPSGCRNMWLGVRRWSK